MLYPKQHIEICRARRYGLPMAARGQGARNLDPGTTLILRELRDMRGEMRTERRRADADRRQANADRRQADAERRQADAERRQADEAWREERRRAEEAWQEERRQADAERRQADAGWREERRQADEAWRQTVEKWDRDRQQSDQRIEQAIREFREDSIRREVVTQKALRDIRVVGLSIVKTLNLHTRLLQGIDSKLGALGPWRPSSGDGRGA